MTDLFAILDGIDGSDYAESILASTEEIERYAEACGESITTAEALKIQAAGQRWRKARLSDGEWSRLRDEARAATTA